MTFDKPVLHTLGGIVAILLVATVAGHVIRRRSTSPESAATIENLIARLNAWWWMVAIVGVAVLSGLRGSLVLFGLLSFLALREFITLVPTRRGDHRALFWSFFIITPVQYILIAMHWYGLFTIFIPAWVFLLLPTRMALAGDTECFLERAAKVQWGLMICVYCLSCAPALLMRSGTQGARLLLYLIVIDQMSDVLQYCFGKLMGQSTLR